jgi:aspartyl-tRNA(Asn)/glutamyl-tRNA(Gln) amidotransferase subunit B
VKSGEMPSVVMKDLEVTQISDREALEQIVDEVFAKETVAVQDALKNEKAINFLLGKVIQATKGRADPKLATELIRKKLASIT